MTIEEYTITAGPTATLAREFVWGTEFPMPVAIVDWTAAGQVGTGQAEVLHYLRDVLGNVVALTDAGGNVVERYRYDAYGTTHIYNVGGTPLPTSAYGNPYAYTGQRYDAAVRLYNSWFRTYSPALGRWMQRDPIGYVDGVSLYQYVESGPIDRQDPLGLTRFGPFWPWGIIDDGQPNSPPASQPAPPSAIVAAPPAILGGAGGYWLLGPRGPLFGRGRLRGGNPGWFNRGNFRIGWSWNNFLKKDLFAIHGGRPHTPTHWHIYPFRFMPTHGPVPPWVRFGVRGGQAALVAAAAYVGWEAGSALDSRFGLSKSIGQWIFDELFPKGGGKLIEPCDVVRTTGGNRCY
jgi:RHS repeat-associated protein